MTVFHKWRKSAMAAFILMYLAVSQIHLHQHLSHVLSDGGNFAAASVAQPDDSAGTDMAGVWISLPGTPCPGELPAGSQEHQSCNCSMSQFTVQPRFENQFLLASQELSYPTLDQLHSQPFLRGVNPPPRVA